MGTSEKHKEAMTEFWQAQAAERLCPACSRGSALGKPDRDGTRVCRYCGHVARAEREQAPADDAPAHEEEETRMATTRRQASKLTELADTADLKVLGWTLSLHLGETTIERDALLALLTARGFGYAAPKPPSYKTALKRAILAWVRQRARGGEIAPLGGEGGADNGDGTRSRSLVRVVNKGTAKYMAYVVVGEQQDMAELGLEYSTGIRFILDKEGGSIVATTQPRGNVNAAIAEAQQVQAEIRPLYEEQQRIHTALDVSLVVRQIIYRAGASNLRDGGGYYFLPMSDHNRQVVENLGRLFDDLEAASRGEAFLLCLPQIDVAEARRGLAHAAHNAMVAELNALQVELDQFLAAKPGTVREATIARQLALYKEVADKAETYQTVLGMRAEKIEAMIAQATGAARAVILKGTAEEEEEPAEGAPEPGAPGAAAEGEEDIRGDLSVDQAYAVEPDEAG